MTKYAMSVSGPVPAERLGITLPHEHLLIDMAVRYTPNGDDDMSDWPNPVQRWRLLRDPAAYRANLGPSDKAETLTEMGFFKAAGGQTIVDLSPHGLAVHTDQLPELAKRSGLTVIAGTGTYIAEAMPPWAQEASIDDLVDRFVGDLTHGGADNVLRGVIGEIGIESANEAEVRAVRASARAQAATGAPCFWHVMSGILPSTRPQVLALVDIYEREGGDPTSLVLCHQDASGDDAEYQRSVLRRGIWLAIDNFGFESVFGFESGYLQNPTDSQRIETVAKLLNDGWHAQILISQDICYRMMRRTWGGWGFAHILDTLTPRFAAAGIDNATLLSLMRDNPSRLLAYSDTATPSGTR